MERMHFTYEQAITQPAYIVELAFLVWELDAKRDRLKSGNNNSKAT